MSGWRVGIVVAVLFAVVPVCAQQNPPAVSSLVEFRALWVDGFHAGIRTPQEAERLVSDARQAGINVLIVQVRRRGDAYYTRSLEPPVEDAAYDPAFDALDYIVDLAHRSGLEVHAWMNAMPVWRDAAPPSDPRHIFNQHGMMQTGEANWLTATPTGEQKFPVGYFLDPGHPEAADHVARICANLVKNYNVDGVHLDYIRYPETNERAPHGAPVGYNAVSVDRFRRATRRADLPAPDDPQWVAWRRQQVTQLVRRIYLEVKALNPRVRVSAAVIPWGKPPAKERDFEQAAPMQQVFQNWHGWLQEGILDLAIPMNYARENDPRVRQWFDGWIRWEKKYKRGRQLAIGLGAYLNSPQATLAQIQRARLSADGHQADGLSLFSYASLVNAPLPSPGTATTEASASPPEPATSGTKFLFDSGAFASAATVPRPQWLDRPQSGWILGTFQQNGRPADNVEVQLRRRSWWPFRRTRRVLADGNGVFGFCELKPGKYQVRATPGNVVAIEVQAGQVTRVQIGDAHAQQSVLPGPSGGR